MSEQLKGKKIAILATDGFEEVELSEPRKELEEAGAETHLVAPNRIFVTAWDHLNWGDEYDVDVHLDNADPSDYDALLLPGGVLNPDKLRMNKKAIEFIIHFLHEGKPIAAICHGPQLLIETNELKGKTMTSYPSVKTDLINAGVNWVDKEVVVDQGIITSRSPDDLAAFNEKIIEEFNVSAHKPVSPH